MTGELKRGGVTRPEELRLSNYTQPKPKPRSCNFNNSPPAAILRDGAERVSHFGSGGISYVVRRLAA